MSPHLLKLRARRFWRRRAAQALLFAHDTSELFEQHGFARLSHLRDVWRFVVVWLFVFVLIAAGLVVQIVNLRSYYQVWQPIPGGRFSEGITGTFTTANPLYAVSDVDTAVSRLLFASLLTYDSQNHLVGDLAESWSADPGGRIYTVRLRSNLVWQDGQPLTSEDVAYTYRTIQNPDARSPLFSSWQGVKVTVIDSRVLTFTLPNPLSSFPTSLTNGIVPKHVLQSVDPIDLRSVSFNTSDPIGAGPFRWGTIGVSGIGDNTESQISLVPFGQYWAGAPKLVAFDVSVFANKNNMLQAYQNQELTAIAGLDAVPGSIHSHGGSYIYNLSLTAGVYVFFRTTSPLLNDPKVRQALVLAANPAAARSALGYKVTAVDEPLLAGELGYDSSLQQVANNPSQAGALLDAAGWHLDANNMRTKDGKELAFTLVTPEAADNHAVASVLQKEWRGVGVSVQIVSKQPADMQATLSSHLNDPNSYDALLYGISIGVDPDVYAYWDSSQNDLRSVSQLNFSEYKSAAADLALEAGRTRLDPIIRVAKYRAFLQAWQQGTPALALYQPRFLYISHVSIAGLTDGMVINSDDGRFANVQDWMIDRGWVTRPQNLAFSI